jgi:hypothetical protein
MLLLEGTPAEKRHRISAGARATKGLDNAVKTAADRGSEFRNPGELRAAI